eukprot:GHUV01026375.1.p1 GENE.GHUV01026375.1~~GHUV01026375.1.p1  ORF type:complete len:446 (+),score=151.46 GHUV01026375.1:39-1376(+)
MDRECCHVSAHRLAESTLSRAPWGATSQRIAAVSTNRRSMEGVNVYRVLQKRTALQGTSKAVDNEHPGDGPPPVAFATPPGSVDLSTPTDGSSSPHSSIHSSIHDSVDSDKLTSLPSTTLEKAAVAEIKSKDLMSTAVTLDDDQQAISQTAPRMRAPEREVHASFLAAGDNGVGKTTFLHQLINSYRQAPGIHYKAAAADGCSMHQFVSDPESLAIRLGPIRVPEERLNIQLSLQDSPGVGDDINYKSFLRMLVKHLLQQQETDYKLLGGNIQHLGPAMAGTLKNSVTALLYFLPPHKLKKLDIIMMAALSQLVPLIPVVGKADTMTQQEALKYRDELVAALQDADGFVGRGDSSMRPLEVNLFQFPDEDLLNVNVTPSSDKHIYFVITSDTYQDGRPVRVYPYGVFDAANREHSDFIVLKRLLMSDQVSRVLTGQPAGSVHTCS